MIHRIIRQLKENGVRVYRINETRTETAELYFIRRKLDIPRLKEITEYEVTVYFDTEREGKKLRGRSSTILSPGMTDEEIAGRIHSAYYAASFALNPFYELPDAVAAPKQESASDLAALPLTEAVLRFAEAMFSADTAEDAFINSAELFAERQDCRILASNGLDVSYGMNRISGEYVAQCVTPADVEQFRQFAYDSFCTEGIRQKVAEAIEDVRARACAKASPRAGTYSVLLKAEHIRELLEFYLERSEASMIFPGYSTWKAGDAVQGENVTGEKIRLTLVPVQPYSDEGIPMKERPLVRDGVLQTVHGGNRFCRYLGIEPTGDYTKVACSNGTVPLASLRGEGVLEPVSFSDFQMDVMDGHFKGEIRLAFLHHADGSVEKLTGGSINGAFLDLQKRLTFSTERYEDMNYEGPLGVLIPDVAVAGCTEEEA